MPLFFERFLERRKYNDFRHFILAYELQKRYFVRNDQGEIQKIRNLASSIRQGRGVQTPAGCHPQPGLRLPDPAPDRLPGQAAKGSRSARTSTP